jgi:rod shape-determining protein MreC
MREFALVAFLCMAGFLLGKYQTFERGAGRIDPFGRAIHTVVAPVATVGARIANGSGAFFHGVLHASELEAENARLKSLAGSAGMYNQTLDELQGELDAMRRLLKLPAYGNKTKVPAEITGLFLHEARISLNVGLKQGVRPGLPVLSADGLLATIQSANADTSQALLISSPSQRIAAMVLRNPPAAGLMRGETATSIFLELFDAAAPVDQNDLVVTSGFSDNIPRGVPVGRVVQVVDNKEFGTRRVQIYPNAIIGTVREVVILK